LETAAETRFSIEMFEQNSGLFRGGKFVEPFPHGPLLSGFERLDKLPACLPVLVSQCQSEIPGPRHLAGECVVIAVRVGDLVVTRIFACVKSSREFRNGIS